MEDAEIAHDPVERGILEYERLGVAGADSRARTPGSRDLNHIVGEVDSGDARAQTRRLGGGRSRAATAVEHCMAPGDLTLVEKGSDRLPAKGAGIIVIDGRPLAPAAALHRLEIRLHHLSASFLISVWVSSPPVSDLQLVSLAARAR